MPRRDVGRNDPCPCGSGAKYKQCCLREEKKRRDRRARKQSGGTAESSDAGPHDRDRTAPETAGGHDPNDCERCQRMREMTGGDVWSERDYRRVDRFAGELYAAVELGSRLHGELVERGEESLVTRVIEDLGFDPWRFEPTDDVRLLFAVYAFFGDAAIGGSRASLRRAFADAGGESDEETFETIREGRVVAFDFETEPFPRVEPLTGRTDHEPHDVLDVIGIRGRNAEGDETYVGWQFEVRGAPLVLFAVGLRDEAARRLREAAEASAWGRSAESFRRTDYEIDLLTAAYEPTAELDLESDGRVLSVPGRDTDEGIEPAWEAFQVFRQIRDDGLQPGLRPEPWHVTLAEAVDGEALESLKREISGIVNVISEMQLLFAGGELEEDDSIRAEAVLDWLGLEPDGSMVDDRAPDWREHSIEELSVDGDLLDRFGLRAEATVGDARELLDEREGAAADELRAAVELHRRRVRWIATMTFWREDHVNAGNRLVGWPGEPDLSDWLAGVSRYFRATLERRPLRELPETDGRYRKRLVESLDDALECDEPLEVEDLPDSRHRLEEIPGIGEKTAARTSRAIRLLVEQWWNRLQQNSPTSARPDEDSQRKIAEGLDGLADAFRE